MSRIAERREVVASLLSAAVGLALFYRAPFPEQNPLLQFILLQKSQLFFGIKYAYLVMLFTTPYIGFSVLFSLLYIFGARAGKNTEAALLPAYPEPAGRDRLYLIIG